MAIKDNLLFTQQYECVIPIGRITQDTIIEHYGGKLWIKDPAYKEGIGECVELNDNEYAGCEIKGQTIMKKDTMTLDRYRTRYNQAPFMLYEFAEGAIEIDDAPDLKTTGELYLLAKLNFEQMLKTYNIEQG